MSSSGTSSKSKSKAEAKPRLYRHTKRAEWGVAILVREEPGRRVYQFDDGKLRMLKEEFCGLLEAVDDLDGDVNEVIADLREAAARRAGKADKVLKPEYTFDEQLAIFKAQFKKGFEDKEWIETQRGTGAESVRKRHREPIAERAQKELSKRALDKLLADEKYDEVFERAIAILKATDLVSVSKLKPIAAFDEDGRRDYALTLRELLHGKDMYGMRFQAHVTAIRSKLGHRPSWRIATALPALVFPQKHVCVRSSAFLRQAALFAPTAFFSKRPRRRGYQNFRKVARRTREMLIAAKVEPRDLLDVHDFIWATLRPAAARYLPKK